MQQMQIPEITDYPFYFIFVTHTFLKYKTKQQLDNTPDFTLNYFLKPQRLDS